jgi:crotonobetainyl-CoA:carnitine CoA-transferase CaiB-like acyl-CoA transferase
MTAGYLSDVRVLDFSRNLAGPYSTLLLAFLGAEVIQLENPYRQEVMRRNSPAQCGGLRLNKLSLGIDLTNPEAAEIVTELARISDIVVEAFKAGTLVKMGIGYEVLSAANPRLVMVSLSGMGQAGPEANYRAYAQIFGTLGGLAHFTGYKGGLPTEQRASLDHRVGQKIAFAALAGLIHSRRTGEGQHIDVSARECLTSEIGDLLMDFALNRRDKGPSGNEDVYMAPHNTYPCKGTDAWVSIAVATDEEWRSLCGAIGRPELVEDDRFHTQLDRWKNQREIDPVVAAWTIELTDYDATEILQRRGVAAFPVLNSEQVFADPHLRARRALQDLDDPQFGHRMVLAPPWKLENNPARITSPSPMLSADNRYVMKTLLGKPDAEIADLESRQVLLSAPTALETASAPS